MFKSSTYQDCALLVMRFIVAAIFLYVGGYGKLFIWYTQPEGMQAEMVNLMKFLSIVEPLGGIALVAGFLTRWAAAGLGIIMIGAVGFIMYVMQGTWFTSPLGAGADYVLLILASCIVLMAFGPGKWSVDALWKKA